MRDFLKERRGYINDMLLEILAILPPKLSAEISRVGKHRFDYPLGLSEIRVRSEGRSALVISGENVPLFTKISGGDIMTVYDKALGGALYAHIDEVKNGFISMPFGIRVGISASRSEAGLAPSDISSLVFRLPTSESESAGALFSVWQKERPVGMLIYSLPGGGKTSALRSLAALISRELLMRVAVIDERREFIPENYADCTVDILKGYGKAEGLEIAMRTLSPELMIIDEIGSACEAEALLSVGRGGVPIIASAHAGSFDEVIRKASVKRLFDEGYFSVFVRLFRDGGKFRYEVTSAKDCGGEKIHSPSAVLTSGEGDACAFSDS